MQLMTAAELINALGGTAKVAEALGTAQNTVGNWLQRGIPAWAMPKLARLCRKRGVNPGMTLEPQQPRSPVRERVGDVDSA